MRKIVLIAAAAALLALAIWLNPHCTPDSPKGPTIGGVIKLGGC